MSPNPANVGALYDALNGMLHSTPQERGEDHYAWLRKCAAHLASSGVLVPSALTNEQGSDIASISDFTTMRSDETNARDTAAVRAALERIARGDQGA